jgi:hypothetical protein
MEAEASLLRSGFFACAFGGVVNERWIVTLERERNEERDVGQGGHLCAGKVDDARACLVCLGPLSLDCGGRARKTMVRVIHFSAGWIQTLLPREKTLGPTQT